MLTIVHASLKTNSISIDETSYTNHHQIELNDKTVKKEPKIHTKKKRRERKPEQQSKSFYVQFLWPLWMFVDRLNVGCCGTAAGAADGRDDFCDFNWMIPQCL